MISYQHVCRMDEKWLLGAARATYWNEELEKEIASLSLRGTGIIPLNVKELKCPVTCLIATKKTRNRTRIWLEGSKFIFSIFCRIYVCFRDRVETLNWDVVYQISFVILICSWQQLDNNTTFNQFTIYSEFIKRKIVNRPAI